MVPFLSTASAVLLGSPEDRFGRRLDVLLALAVGVLTFGAYALDLFVVADAALLLPWDATLVGFVTAGVVGSRGGGLAFGWSAAAAPLFGYAAASTLLGSAGGSLVGRLGNLFGADVLAYVLVVGWLVGTLGFVGGGTLRYGSSLVRRRLGRAES